MIIGRIHDTVRLAGLTAKWEQKKQNIGKKQAELTPEERQIEHFREQLEDIREGNESNAISAKINSGAKLTPEEIEYLRRENPQALQAYEEIQQEKENYKRQLKNCRTKEDVEKLKQQKMGEFMAAAKKADTNPNIPKEQKLAMLAKILAKVLVVEEVHYEFTKSLAYQSLPTEEEKQQAEKAAREQKMPEMSADGQEIVEESEAAEQVIEFEQSEVEGQVAEPEQMIEAEQSEEPDKSGEARQVLSNQPHESYNPQAIRRDIESMMRRYKASSKKVDVLA